MGFDTPLSAFGDVFGAAQRLADENKANKESKVDVNTETKKNKESNPFKGFGDVTGAAKKLAKKTKETKKNFELDAEIINNLEKENKQINEEIIKSYTQNSNIKGDELNLFSPTYELNKWYVDRSKQVSLKEQQENDRELYFHTVLDTEYHTRKKKLKQQSRQHITTQEKGISKEAPSVIFVNPELDCVNLSRIENGLQPFPLAKAEASVVDYLNYINVPCHLEKIESTTQKNREKQKGLKKFIHTIYSHYQNAEICMAFSGGVKENIKKLIKSESGARIECNRRLQAITPLQDGQLDYVELDYYIWIKGVKYIYCIRCVDTGAIHGVASYSDFCKAVGWKLKYKDNFTSEEKGRMLAMTIERPKEFEQYALGDLDVYEALDAYYHKWEEVYRLLGLSQYYQAPKLTIGGSVKDLLCGAIASKLGLQGKDWLKELNEVIDTNLIEQSAGKLREYSKDTKALLAKVEGGRCRNNQPTTVFKLRKINGKYDAVLICDIDISGCYGEGQRNQLYFIGNPEVISWDVKGNNKYKTLYDWLKDYDVQIDELCKIADKAKKEWFEADEKTRNKFYKQFKNPELWGELIPGGWYLRFSVEGELSYDQDFFASWFTDTGNGVDVMTKFINKMKCDSEQLVTDWVNFNEEEGNLKIFNRSINNAVLTQDGLEWILAVASKRQRKEFLEKTQILASSVYPKSQEIKEKTPVENLQKLNHIKENWQFKTTKERVDRGDGVKSPVTHDRSCYAWFGLNIGNLLVEKLLIERKKSKIRDGKKSPLDLLFKLCVNTLYGDMVSKFFATANTVVGNSITARARALCWYMEKGLHGFQSITDGCGFEPYNVILPGRDLVDGEAINLHRKDSKLNRRKVKKGCLGEAKSIEGIPVIWESWEDEKPVKKSAVGLRITHQDGSIEELKPKLKTNKENPKYQDLGENPGTKWMDREAMLHLQNIFPLLTVLHEETTSIKVDKNLKVKFDKRKGQFEFETKDLYVEGCFHGSANYLFRLPHQCEGNTEGQTIKLRGHEAKRKHESYKLDGLEIVVTETYTDTTPGRDFLEQLITNPHNIKRQQVAIKEGIVKPGDYRNRSESFDYLGLEPGDNLLKSVLFKEYSNSQFCFKTYEQYCKWKKFVDKNSNKNKQSVETYFLNPDGNLDFPNMVKEVDQAISEGIDEPGKYFDKNRHRKRDLATEHPAKPTLEKVKAKLSTSRLED